MPTEVHMAQALTHRTEYVDRLNGWIDDLDTPEQWFGFQMALLTMAAHAALYRAGVPGTQQTPDGPRNRRLAMTLRLLEACDEFVNAEGHPHAD